MTEEPKQMEIDARERAIDIVASEPTDELGISRVIGKGLLTKREIIGLMADSSFVVKVEERRESLLGEVVEQVKLIAKRAAPSLMIKLVAIADGKERAKRHQVDAIKAVLERADVDHGNAVVPGLFMALFARIQQGKGAPGMITAGDDEDREPTGG